MNATKLGLRLTSSVLATALCFAPANGVLAAPAGADESEDEGEDEAPEEEAEGEDPEGEEAEGEDPEGEDTEGEDPEGEDTEGEDTEGEDPEGEEAEGEDTEGETAEGEEGETAEGEGETAEGPTDAEVAEDAEEPEGADAEIEEEAPAELAEGPQRPPEPAWGPKKQYPMNGKGMLITGGVVTGLGAAFIVTSLLITRCDFESSLACKYGDQRNFLVPTAVATTALGLMLVGVGVGNRIKYKKWENWTPEKTAIAPTFMRGGGGIAIAGQF